MKLERQIQEMHDEFQRELSELKKSESGESYDLKEQEWEVERKMLMGLIEKNQEYAYNAQEKLKNETENFKQENERIKTSLGERIEQIETENNSLKKLLNEVHISEEDKGKEVKMVRANLIEEIFRVQNIHQRNEDELRKDNDQISIKYSESIKSFKELLKKAEEDNNMLQSKIEEIISDSRQTESDLIFQINDLHRTNNKLVKALESTQPNKIQANTQKSTSCSSVSPLDSSLEVPPSKRTVEWLEKHLTEKANKWKTEKDRLLDEIEKRENIYAEKLALRDLELERARGAYDRQLKLEETKNSTLVKENRILDRTLKGKH
jgi:hypothetical protein